MKLIILLMGLVLTTKVVAEPEQTKAEQAAQWYSLRGYDDAGINNCKKAIELFGEAIAEKVAGNEQNELINDRALAFFFLGSALTEKVERQLAYKNGMDDAQLVLNELLDNKDSHKLTDEEIAALKADLSAIELNALAEAMYLRGVNLAQWGSLEGISTTIGRIDEVLGNMERIDKLEQAHRHGYGPYRTIGRVKYTLPDNLGGDLEESENKLKAAVKNTLAVDADGNPQRYSVNGHNNVYLAETLWQREQKDTARKFLQAFVDGDQSLLDQEIIPENQQALARAKQLVEEWK